MANLRITWIKSSIGHSQEQRQTLKALGLHRLHQQVIHPDSPSLRGMLYKVRHLIQVEKDETA